MKWKHDELANDLASSKMNGRRMVWADMQLGPSGSPRPDVYTIECSYSNPKPTAYEIKVSRSDFLSDIKSGKYLKYFKYAGQVWFACPEGLVSRAEVPDQCGLIVRKDRVWRSIKRATVNSVSLPQDAMLKLLIDGVGRVKGQAIPAPRKATAWNFAAENRKRLGENVCRVISDIDGAESYLKTLIKRRDEINAEFVNTQRQVREIKEIARKEGLASLQQQQDALNDQVKNLCVMLGANGTSIHSLRRFYNSAHLKINADDEVKVLRLALNSVQAALDKINTPAYLASIDSSEAAA